MLDILQSLQESDCVSFRDQKLNTDQVWNTVDLFLRQGLFFDDLFPPTMKLQLMDVDVFLRPILLQSFDVYESV